MSLYRGQDAVLTLATPVWSNHDPTSVGKELLVVNGEVIGCVLRNLLNQAECDHFIQQAEELGMVDVSHSTKYCSSSYQLLVP